ncbi:sensor histidine kinase [Pygmaiobacter massiliensis]|uniref:sensor histidine kinase n=1 Tax=Pygmaiobacter massiliensis TaxID=1917873 RepID=UPI0015E0D929|nr:ATP-binding protein [Pygmaiobacter massiliensis]
MKKLRLKLTIENKILIPFLAISMLSILCFGIILYYNGYTVKMSNNLESANTLVRYIETDLDTMLPLTDSDALLEKYHDLGHERIEIFDENGVSLLGGPVYQTIPKENIIAESQDNVLSWRICYILDREDFQASLLEEQKYIIIATIALLIITVQVSIFVSYNISEPIRCLSEICTEVSAHPERPAGKMEEFATRRDEIGQLADAFQTMLKNINSHTAELLEVKTLNENIVENLPTGIVAYTPAGEVICINSKAISMLTNEEFRNHGKTLQQLLDHILATDQVLHDPLRLQNAEGRTRAYDVGVWRLRWSDESEWGTLCTIDDITYNKMMEEKVSETEKLAYTGKVAAMLAHEIRNPLAGIRASIQVISRRMDGERDKMLCNSMVHEVDRVNVLIEDLLNLSRKRESQKTLLSLNALFDELLMLYSKIAENNGIKINALAMGNLSLYADESEIKQVLVNLINNSIKAIPNGGWIALQARAEQGCIVILVKDNGVGMDEAKLRGILESRTDSGAKAKAGYGLSIVSQLLAQNGGEFQIESTPGKGTEITIIFRRQGELSDEARRRLPTGQC